MFKKMISKRYILLFIVSKCSKYKDGGRGKENWKQ